MTAKPQTASGYSREESAQVKSACLTIAAILGDLMDEICIVGGLVPSMICDTEIDPAGAAEDAHCGTNDLDVGLSVALLDNERYREVSTRLRGRGFAPDEKEGGQRVRQRWRWGKLKVTVDFLIPPTPELGASGKDVRIQSLERDFAALVVKGLHLAFDERIARALDGRNLLGDEARREVWFAGPAAFVAMKANAYHLRGEPKDAYDLVYVLRHWGAGVRDVAKRMAEHAERREPIVLEALAQLGEDFEKRESAGPRDAARFIGGGLDDARIADAYGAVSDLLAECRRHGIVP